ncbi:MAG TPA: IS1634 family transposase [Syntrophobacteraceae bacterium]|nr:IS1634 family transposase [Syntrophobacteraceae bacterium]
MPHLYKKTFEGRTYWYLREVHRVNGKVKLKWQKYLGTAETILAKMEQAELAGRPSQIRTESFGALFTAYCLELELDTIGIIDSVISRARNETGPTVGEYFFYAWANRMIAPRSKRGLEEWYRKTAIQQIRPVELSALSSERYWEKWQRLSAAQIEEIGRRLLQEIWGRYKHSPHSLLFDTTNYYTYMATKTESELAVRGHNKSGKHHLRQVGLGLLLDRDSSLPLYYKVYPGNLHDSELFRRVLDEMFGLIMGFADEQKHLTVVFDKGMNSKDNLELIDGREQIHFITTYSTYFAEELARINAKHFVPLDIEKNRQLMAARKEGDRLCALRTTENLWGRERTAVVNFNPLTMRKKLYDFTGKLERLRAELIEYRRKYNRKERDWQSSEAVTKRYRKLCDQLYVSHKCYRIRFQKGAMSFRKDFAEVRAIEAVMGKNIIVTDNHDWSTEQIVTACLDRYRIEQQFRASKASCHIQVNPMFHWTDGKIRCHLLTCVIALACLRLLEIKTGDKHTAKAIIEQMGNLNCVLAWQSGAQKPQTYIEDPTDFQVQVLASLGYQIKGGSVLHV